MLSASRQLIIVHNNLRIVDQYGRAVVFKNNAPRYMIIDFNLIDNIETATTDDVLTSSAAIMDRFDKAFEALAK